jgi:hypothetical protein
MHNMAAAAAEVAVEGDSEAAAAAAALAAAECKEVRALRGIPVAEGRGAVADVAQAQLAPLGIVRRDP